MEHKHEEEHVVIYDGPERRETPHCYCHSKHSRALADHDKDIKDIKDSRKHIIMVAVIIFTFAMGIVISGLVATYTGISDIKISVAKITEKVKHLEAHLLPHKK